MMSAKDRERIEILLLHKEQNVQECDATTAQ